MMFPVFVHFLQLLCEGLGPIDVLGSVNTSLFGLFDGVVLIPPSSLATSSRRERRCIVTLIVNAISSGSLSSGVSGINVPEGGSVVAWGGVSSMMGEFHV